MTNLIFRTAYRDDFLTGCSLSATVPVIGVLFSTFGAVYCTAQTVYHCAKAIFDGCSYLRSNRDTSAQKWEQLSQTSTSLSGYGLSIFAHLANISTLGLLYYCIGLTMSREHNDAW